MCQRVTPHCSVCFSEVFLVGDLLHPIHVLSVERLLNSDMRHCGRWRGTVPVFMTRWAPDHVAGSDFDDRFTFTLRPSAPCGDDQCLSQRMRVPGRAGTRFEWAFG